MSNEQPQAESEGSIGQSVSTGGLARCPCGAIPQALAIMDTGQGRKYMACMGTCCGEWMIEFRSDYRQPDSTECMERAIDAWNRAPRMANVEHNRRPQGVRVDGPVGPHTQESVNMLAELTATETVANEICRDIPEGYELRLCMENGAAWVTLHNADGDLIGLPDAADKTIGEQMAEALQVARNGW